MWWVTWGALSVRPCLAASALIAATPVLATAPPGGGGGGGTCIIGDGGGGGTCIDGDCPGGGGGGGTPPPGVRASTLVHVLVNLAVCSRCTGVPVHSHRRPPPPRPGHSSPWWLTLTVCAPVCPYTLAASSSLACPLVP